MMDRAAAGFLSDFGDQAVILPLVAVMAVVLWRSGWRRGALAWSGLVPATLLAVGLAKLLVFRFGPPSAVPALLSPSGHTAAATLVYGGLAAILPRYATPWRRALLSAIPMAVLIGATRLILQVHSPEDVVVGGMIGLIGAVGLAVAAGNRPASVSLWPPILVTVLVVLLFHGLRMPAESWLHGVAQGWAAQAWTMRGL